MAPQQGLTPHRIFRTPPGRRLVRGPIRVPATAAAARPSGRRLAVASSDRQSWLRPCFKRRQIHPMACTRFDQAGSPHMHVAEAYAPDLNCLRKWTLPEGSRPR
jgi:hypothetical protein